MPADSNLPNLPDSPVQGTDLWLINRTQKSYKVTTFDLGLGLIQIELPTFCPNGDSDCPDGFECSNGICVRIECDIEKYPDNAGCPDDYFCWNGYCFPTCGAAGAPGGCAEGNVCVDIDGLGNYICIPYPFPCDNGLCPNGYTCVNGNCYQLCGGSPGAIPGASCPIGSICTELEINGNTIYVCVPFPIACGSLPIAGGDECPPGTMCYGGQCVQICTGGPGQGTCAPGNICTDIGDGISVCLPIDPQESFINDGPLVFRTEPFDYPSSSASENIVFTANQFGRSLVTFEGMDISGGDGGGSGGNINIIVDPDWWDPSNGVSPINDGKLTITKGDGVTFSNTPMVFTANQRGPTDLTISADMTYINNNIGNGKLTIKTFGSNDAGTGTYKANQSSDSTITLPQIKYGDLSGTPTIGNGPLTIKAHGGVSATGTYTANQVSGSTITLPQIDYNDLDNKPTIGNGLLKIKTHGSGNGHDATGSYTANQSSGSTITLPQIKYGDLSGTPTIGNGALTIKAHGGASATGSYTANQSSGSTITLPQIKYGDLDNKPTIGNGALTIKAHGGVSATGSYTANQSSGSTITLPQIKYGDLSGTPTIGNGTLAFKAKSGGNQKTFTANQSGNTEITGADLEAILGPLGGGPQLWESSGTGVRPVTSGKDVLPNGSASIGSSSLPWANIYTQDMHFSNEGTEGNSVDGTTGDWTLQEGEDSVYMINNKTGKKYKFLMEEVD